MIITADDKTLQKELEGLKTLLLKHDCWFHPQLHAVCEEGSMSLKIEGPLAPGEKIIKIPEECLVPADAMNFTVKNDQFEVDPDKDEENITPLQVDIGKRMTELYNLTDKAKLHKTQSAWILYKDHPHLLDLMVNARTTNVHIQKKQGYTQGLPDAMSDDEFTAWSFMQTRVLGQKQSTTNKRIQVIMPFIDFLNHDSRGSPFIMNDDNKTKRSAMSVQNQQPIMDSSECFVLYGIYDAVDTFLSYGFPDTNAPYVRSVPVDVPIEGFGFLKIKGMQASRFEKDLPAAIKDLRQFMPAPTKQPDGSMEVSHLFIPSMNTPHSMRRILQVLIRSLVGSEPDRKFIIDNVYMAEEKIVNANIEFYQSVLKKLEETKGPEDLKSTIRYIANLQLTKLYKYPYNFSYFKLDTGKDKGETDKPAEAKKAS